LNTAGLEWGGQIRFPDATTTSINEAIPGATLLDLSRPRYRQAAAAGQPAIDP